MRWWWKIAVGLVVLELAYVGGVHAFLRSATFLDRLNASPESLKFEIASVWSPFPGLAYVRGFKLRMQDSNVQFWLRLDRARVQVSLLPLLRKRFQATRVEGEGVDFALRRRRPGKMVPEGTRAALPEIPGLSLTEAAKKPAPSSASQEKWKARITGVHVSNVRELWVEEFRFRGKGEVSGGFFLSPGKEAEIKPAGLVIHSGELTIGNRPFASRLHARLEGGIDHFFAKDIQGANFFEYVSGRARISAAIASLDFFNYYLRGSPWLHVSSRGEGMLDGDLSIDKGRLAPGADVVLASPRIAVTAWRQVAEGSGKVHCTVDGGKKPVATLEVLLPEYRMHRKGSVPLELAGHDLGIRIATEDLALRHAFERVRIDATLPRAQIVDLRALDAFLPRAARLHLVGGQGWVEGELHEPPPTEGRPHGKIRLELRGATALYGTTRLGGNVSVGLRIPGGNSQRGIFDLSGSRIELNDVSEVTPGERQRGWWGRVSIPRGFFQLDAPTAFWGRVELEGKDARPMLALLSERKVVPKVVDKLFSFDDLSAKFALRVDDRHLQIHGASVTGGASRIRGWLLKRDRWSDGRWLVEHGPFAAGLSIDSGDVAVHLFEPFRWFDDESRKSGQPLMTEAR